MIGKTQGHYKIGDQPLGRGCMGEVYRAKDMKLGREVAIKVLPEEFACDSERAAPFQREAKILASLNHPNIAAIHGLEESDGVQFLVLKLVEGETLAAVLIRAPEWQQLPPNPIPRIQLVLERCLEKVSKSRCSGIGDARADIQKALADPSCVLVQPINVRSYMFAHKGGVHMKYISIIMGLLLLTSFAFAADIDGKWSGTITGMDMAIEFTFKAEGKTLTGVHIVNGQETAIKDGKIDGNNISFSVTLDIGKFEHKGVISGDQIKMTYDDGSGQSGEIIVKKAK